MYNDSNIHAQYSIFPVNLDEHYNSIQEYIADKRMDKLGSHVEMLTLAHLLQTTICDLTYK